MIRGTTPTYPIKMYMNIDVSLLDHFYITFRQGKKFVTKKFFADDIQGDVVNCSLTQEDTLKFSVGECKVQIRGKLTDGTVFATDIGLEPIYDTLLEGVI